MKKVLLFTVLLLTLAVVVTTPVAAGRPGGPGHGEDRPVVFLGDIEGADTMTVETKGKSVAVYGNIDLTFSDAFGEIFAGPHGHSMRITLKGGETGEVCMGSHLDYYPWQGVDVPSYWFEGSGRYARTTRLVDGTEVTLYEVTLEDVAIYDVVPHRRGKGAIWLEFVQPPAWEHDYITFDMTIYW